MINNNSLTLRDTRTYAWSALFVAGNILLPMLCHLVPNGGQALLPVYFFTLVGAWRYGIAVGLLTGLLSPLACHLLTGMPSAMMLSPMAAQSVITAVACAAAGSRTRTPSFALTAAVATACLIAGLVMERLLISTDTSMAAAFLTALPGIAVQATAGRWLIRHMP